MAGEAAPVTFQVAVAWDRPIGLAAEPSLGVIPMPPLRRRAPLHDRLWSELADIRAGAVRFMPWFAYPRLAVAELEPPTGRDTAWDFSLIDPLVADVMAAQAGRSVMINFSTIPAWMFATRAPKTYPVDPDDTAWTYGGPFEPDDLRDPSLREVAEYYARVASWYVRGYFVDELGRRHESGHHYHFDTWEVLNEPDIEHAARQPAAGREDLETVKRYTRRYDAIVTAVRRVAPAMKFVGGSVAHTASPPSFLGYFLDPRNHRPGVPLDFVSFHFYAKPPAGPDPREFADMVFAQADGFLDAVGYMQLLRQRLTPATKTAANELGIVLPGDFRQIFAHKGEDVSYPIPADFWNLSGALYAYLYARLSVLGVDIASSSQLMGFPGQFPSVTGVDWTTGRDNARLQALKLLVRDFPAGTQLAETSVTARHSLFPPDAVSALGLATGAGQRRLLLVNKRYEPADLALGLGAATVEWIDVTTGSEVRTESCPSLDRLTLGGFGIAVVTLK